MLRGKRSFHFSERSIGCERIQNEKSTIDKTSFVYSITCNPFCCYHHYIPLPLNVSPKSNAWSKCCCLILALAVAVSKLTLFPQHNFYYEIKCILLA
mmetsp:Transcript_5016/g.14408  ORF Transcript_5016/g.14408 Transcript_5016/m.14408 type:complete len:97 (-) Transcript_5016:677-967(-)